MVRDPRIPYQLAARDLLIGTLEMAKYLKLLVPAATWDTGCLIFSWYVSQTIQRDGAGPKISQLVGRYRQSKR